MLQRVEAVFNSGDLQQMSDMLAQMSKSLQLVGNVRFAINCMATTVHMQACRFRALRTARQSCERWKIDCKGRWRGPLPLPLPSRKVNPVPLYWHSDDIIWSPAAHLHKMLCDPNLCFNVYIIVLYIHNYYIYTNPQQRITHHSTGDKAQQLAGILTASNRGHVVQRLYLEARLAPLATAWEQCPPTAQGGFAGWLPGYYDEVRLKDFEGCAFEGF